jgi:hypothetical protein
MLTICLFDFLVAAMRLRDLNMLPDSATTQFADISESHEKLDLVKDILDDIRVPQ